MFNGRKLLIATKHAKEKVIAPLFEKNLGVKCFVSDKFDTDLLGTFSGEIERKDDALKTLRNKCLLAMKENACDLVVASEGSFGVHPAIFFAQADYELMLFMDIKNNVEVLAREISTDTNFNGSIIKSEFELLNFAKKVNFPSHGIILKPAENDFSRIYKGIVDSKRLSNAYNVILKSHGSVYAETDMRANFNPTRMKVIEKTAHKLLNSIQNKCPECMFPWFVVTQVVSGLPCEWCNSPTRSTLSLIYECKKCNYKKNQLFPHDKTKEDPMYCDFCNP